MKKVAELRRMAMAEVRSQRNSYESNSSSSNPTKTNSQSEYESERDYFLSERKESELEKVLISLRLTNKLHDGKTTLKHPSSIRKVSNFPLLNSISNQRILIENNPVMWDTEATLLFIENYIPNKSVLMKFQSQDINGETILNLTDKSDLINYFQLDEQSAIMLSSKFEQLRKETILRYVNS